MDTREAKRVEFEKALNGLEQDQAVFRKRARKVLREMAEEAGKSGWVDEHVTAVARKMAALFPGETKPGEGLSEPVIRLLERLHRDEGYDDRVAWKEVENAIRTHFPAELSGGESAKDAAVAIIRWAARASAGEVARQVDQLAQFIMAEVPGEPSRSEGAVDTAIRLLRSYANQVRVLNEERDRARDPVAERTAAQVEKLKEFLTAWLGTASMQHTHTADQVADRAIQIIQNLSTSVKSSNDALHASNAASDAIQSALAKYFPNVSIRNLSLEQRVERALQLGREGIDREQALEAIIGTVAGAVHTYFPRYSTPGTMTQAAVATILRIEAGNRETIRKYLAGEGLPVPETDFPVDALLELAMNRKRTIDEYERMQVASSNDSRWTAAYDTGFKDGQRREREQQKLAAEQAVASEVIKAHEHTDSNEPAPVAPRPRVAAKELMVQLTTDEDALIQANNQLERAKQVVEQARARLGKTAAEVGQRLGTEC